jgi:hypothetical protein
MSDEALVEIITCKRCGQQKPPSKSNRHLCDECVKVEDNRVAYYRQHNYNWMDVAKEAGIEIWERQPGETDREWQVWLAYRDAYPATKPSYRLVAEQLGTTINVVKKVGQRWGFAARLQAWAKYCDELTLKARQEQIVAMNEKHISMAEKINQKLQTAIDNIDPYSLKPAEIQGLFKLSTEIERKARLDEADVYKPTVVDDTNPDLKQSPTKTEDLSEVIGILAKAGLLTGQLGVRKTTTTEVVVKNE